jgi:predicted TIM-barrel fold metal-dependent hydrolase
MTWLPTFLSRERHLSVLNTGGYLAVVIAAFWCGCMASAYLLDRIGRRRNVAFFAFCCIVTVLAYVMLPLSNTEMLILGFPLGFFAAGIPASLGALFNELYPADMRGTGVGFCYNFGRIASAGFPVLVGYMSHSMSLGAAIGIDAAIAYGLAMVAVMFLPETRGKRLRPSSVENSSQAIKDVELSLNRPRSYSMNRLIVAAGHLSRRVDTHAHVFSTSLPLAVERRYAPDYDAPLKAYLKLLDAHDIGNAVLVQPSFLGTDNSCLLRALAETQGRIKGVAVVSPDVTREELSTLRMAGVAGIRLNLMQQTRPDLGDARYTNLWRWLGELGYHVELHREAADIAPLIQFLLDTGLPVVVDHFGRPHPQQGTNDPGFQNLLRFCSAGRVWVKISGAYRCAAPERILSTTRPRNSLIRLDRSA